MKFAKRLQTALFENVLTELAAISLEEPMAMPGPDGRVVHIKYLDMRWEDYKNPYIARWGQWTPFIAELPPPNGHTKRYLIWNGIKAWISTKSVPEFYTAPSNWWEMAQGMDEHGHVVTQPKVARQVEINARQ